MKNHFIKLFVVPLIFLFSCQGNVDLTDDQKATITAEIESLYTEAISNLSLLDIEVWSANWSKDGLLSVNSGINYFSSFVEFRDSVEYWFSLRETQEVEILEQRVTVFESDLALLTSTASWEIQFKDETELSVKALATLLWKKETEGWKIIHLHESWQQALI